MIHQINSLQEYFQEYGRSIRDPEQFWHAHACQFYWHKQWDSVLEWNFTEPSIKWFLNGKLNITENALDRYLFTHGDRPAIIWEPNDPKDEAIRITYKELHAKVCQFARVLQSNGVQKGDRVCIYMPMVPELAIAMLACARIGAVHSIVFAGFSASALADRILDAGAKVLLTSDEALRGKKTVPVKAIVDEAKEKANGAIRSCIVLKKTGGEVTMEAGVDKWWHEEIDGVSDENLPATEMDSEDMLFILYTSGSTGKPKGVVHTVGGYMVYTAYTFRNVFQYKDGEVFWCTADIGWITGHSYIVYGPLLNGATSIMFEGVPSYPDAGRMWQAVERNKVNIFYTAPTAIRALEGMGNEWPQKYNLDSLRVLGTVGEPINEEAWHWYHDMVGKNSCPIVDTWWQTETGGMMISPLAGITPTKPTYATLPLPGVQLVVVDNDGKELKGNNVEGNLCVKFPWPGMLRTTYGDHDRCRQTYFSTFPGLYFTGDGVRRDEDGYYKILGRVDDVINVSGHRFGTAEIENAINEHHLVTECAVVGYPHEIKGQGIYSYIVVNPEWDMTDDQLRSEIIDIVNKLIGPIAKPDKIQLIPGLPKTRSGKIMRRILRKIAANELGSLGDTSTLVNPEIVDEIIAGAQAPKAKV